MIQRMNHPRGALRPSLLILVALLAGTGGTANAQCEKQELNASDGMASDDFGGSVDVDGNRAIVGSDDEGVAVNDQGAAYVFSFDGTTWTEDQKLVSPSPGSRYHLGASVAISGDTAIAGVPEDDDVFTRAGSVEVWRHDGATWVHLQELVASDPGDGDRFGWDVDSTDSHIVVGAKFNDDTASNSGSAYVFSFNGLNWVEDQKLVGSDASQNAQFGDAVAIDGGVIVVGAWQDEGAPGGFSRGAAYVYRFNGASWVEEQKLTASDASDFRWFGRSVDVDGSLITVGAYAADVGGLDGGAVYVYRYNGSTWDEETKLTASDAADGDELGWSCAISGDKVFGGARRAEGAGVFTGTTYAFENTGGTTWAEVGEFFAADGGGSDEFGVHMAADGDHVIVGAWAHDPGGSSNAGAAYYFSSGANCSLGTPFCFGDGSDGAICPCANFTTAGVQPAGCEHTALGLDLGGRVTASGLASVADDTDGTPSLIMDVTGGFPNEFGMFVSGTSTFGAPAPVQLQNGVLCITPNLDLNRYFAAPAAPFTLDLSGAGSNAYSLADADNANLPATTAPGVTIHYQFWFRDNPGAGGGPCGQGANLTSGESVTWAI